MQEIQLKSMRLDPYDLFPLLVNENGIQISSPKITPFSKLPAGRRLMVLPELVHETYTSQDGVDDYSPKYYQTLNYKALEQLDKPEFTDFVVYEYDPKNHVDRAAEILLCEPNGWSAYTHIGQSFEAIHEHVTNAKDGLVMPKPKKIVERILNLSEPHERIGAMSFREDMKLDRHAEDYIPQMFESGRLYLRFERQGIEAFKELNCFIFTIQTVFVDLTDPYYARPFLEAVKLNGDQTYFRDALKDEVIGKRIMRILEINAGLKS